MKQMHYDVADTATHVKCPRCHALTAIFRYARFTVQSFFCSECEFNWCIPADVEASQAQATFPYRLRLMGALLRTQHHGLTAREQWQAAMLAMPA